MNSTKERNSAFELIRIIAMSLILIGHFLCHGITVKEIEPETSAIIGSYFSTGVNLFFLISGWFLIKFSFKKLFSFSLLILCYCLLNYVLSMAFNIPVSLGQIARCFLWPISNSPYWFIQVYLFMILISPIINKGLKNLQLSQLRVVILILTIGTVYSCCWGGNLSNKGFSFLQGLYLYCMGYYLHIDIRLRERIQPWFCYVGYFVLIGIGNILTATTIYLPCDQYTSFSLVGASVLLTIALSKLKFHSSAINLIGGASLGCYLLQDGYFGSKIIYPFLHNLWITGSNLFLVFSGFAIIFVAFWIVAIIINPVFKALSSWGGGIICNTKLIKYLSHKIGGV